MEDSQCLKSLLPLLPVLDSSLLWSIGRWCPLGIHDPHPLKLTRGDSKFLRHLGSNFICWNAFMYITSAELPLSTKTLLVLYPSMVNMIMREIIMRLLDSPCIPFGENNVFISYSIMLGYWVPYVDTIELPLDYLSQGSIWPPSDWSSSDRPYFSYNLFRMVSLIFFLVVIRLLFHLGAGLIIFLDKVLEFPFLD